MTNTQYIDALTKLYKQVDDLAPYNVEEKRVYILDYIQSQLFGIKTNKKPARSQLAEIVLFIDKYYRSYDDTGSDAWKYVYSIFDYNYTIIVPAMVLNVKATFGIPNNLKADDGKCDRVVKETKSAFTYIGKLAENGVNTVSVSYEDIVKHLKINGRGVKAMREKPFSIGDALVNPFYISSIFRMLKTNKLEFIINKNKPIVIKDAGVVVGAVFPMIKR